MKKLRPLVALTLALTLVTSSMYGQDSYCQEDGNYSSAYVESSHATHWSVYIPIAILVGAAIWFGIADRSHDHHSSSDSQDGLGSLASSKRMSSSSYSGDSYRRSSSYSPSSHLSSSYRARKCFSGSHSH